MLNAIDPHINEKIDLSMYYNLKKIAKIYEKIKSHFLLARILKSINCIKSKF